MIRISEADSALFNDLTVTLDALDAFFASLTPAEWAAPHGAKWRFCDVPVHLASFNSVLAEILRGQPFTREVIATQAQIDAFNDLELARHGTNDGAQALAQFRESARALQDAIMTLPDFDAPVYLPILRARGWFKARLGVEYIAFHNWLHFAEAHLRLRGSLPDLPENVTARAVDFFVQLIPGTLNLSAAQNVSLVWRLKLTGTGGSVWTISVKNGRADFSRGGMAKPDLSITASVETFFASGHFRMRSPAVQFLRRRLRVNPRGLAKLGLLGKLFSLPRDQEWALFGREQASPPA